MIEVEIKLKVDNVSIIEENIMKLGFTKISTVVEQDKYFDDECHSIKDGDSALRIRKVTNVDTGETFSQINFKGKKYDNVSMTRPEFETEINDAEKLECILNALGYYAVKPHVVKERHEFGKGDINACIDTVEGLGDYLELEIVVDDESKKDNALNRIEDILAKLGYNIEETTNVSYLSQLMNKLVD